MGFVGLAGPGVREPRPGSLSAAPFPVQRADSETGSLQPQPLAITQAARRLKKEENAPTPKFAHHRPFPWALPVVPLPLGTPCSILSFSGENPNSIFWNLTYVRFETRVMGLSCGTGWQGETWGCRGVFPGKSP